MNDKLRTVTRHADADGDPTVQDAVVFDPGIGDAPPIDAAIELTDEDISTELLPWWRNPAVLSGAALIVATVIGILSFLAGRNSVTDNNDAVDVGFLQDMRWHHDQAVQMSLIFMNKPEVSNSLRVLAAEIAVGQSQEVGRMVEILADMDEPGGPPTDIAMAWMNEPIELSRMPGMATDADIDQLVEAQGAAADDIFVDLMTAHHEGGIHMAEYAAANAANESIRDFAESMAVAQRSEITEMREWLEATK
jgi:uncharacterized protein (DUF305 family)